jgi:sugar (pentulose or hexulose) kinase
MLVAGVDSSTQSCKVVLYDADDGTIAGRGSAPPIAITIRHWNWSPTPF